MVRLTQIDGKVLCEFELPEDGRYTDEAVRDIIHQLESYLTKKTNQRLMNDINEQSADEPFEFTGYMGPGWGV